MEQSNREVNLYISEHYRHSFGKMVASLLSGFGNLDLQLAEDLVQETFVSALDKWKIQLPDNPEGWLFTVCRNKAINHLKKAETQKRRRSRLQLPDWGPGHHFDHIFDDQEIRDSQLRLLFALCHPSLPMKSQVMISLKVLGGLTVREIARGLGMQDEAVKKTLFRVRKAIKERNLPLKVPFVMQSRSRLDAVHNVVYLIFSEGYYSLSGDRMIRKDLCLEAMSLQRQILEIPQIARPDSKALYALMLLNVSRFEARYNSKGEIVDLESQDRKLWQKDLIQLGKFYLQTSTEANSLSRYHLEAGIASLHCEAPDFKSTDWPQILRLYDLLLQKQDSVFVRFNRAVALSQAHGPEKGIEELLTFSQKEQKQLSFTYLLALGKMYQRLGQPQKAKPCLEKALQSAHNTQERQYISSFLVQ